MERDRETLFCRISTVTFKQAGIDPITGCILQVRQRLLPFDVAGASDLPGPLTIALGTPDTLDMTGTDWVVTLIHEYFHEFQSTLPGYQTAVDRLGRVLGGGRSDWELGYAFPYADAQAGLGFAAMNANAEAFLQARSVHEARAAIRRYVASRRAALAYLNANDRLYYEFRSGRKAWRGGRR